MNVPLLDLKRQFSNLKEEINKELEQIFGSCQFILGPQVKKLEADIAEFCGVGYGIGVANGTDALELSLKGLGIGEGDEVITTPFTFFASAEVISKAGATPVFADIDRDTYVIDVKRIEEKITDKTKAIIPVHIFGQACDMDEIMKLARKYNLYVVEDSCQAIGAGYKGEKVSSFGNTGCFSFFPSKNLGGAGDGGMVVSNDQELADKIRVLRQHGSSVRYHHNAIGYNSRLDEIQAAILNIKLRYINEWNELRRKHAYRYNEYLSSSIKKPAEAEYEQYHVYHQYTIEVNNRDELAGYLKENGVGSCVYYPIPLHLQEVYGYLDYKHGDMPNTEEACQRVISLPISPEMTIEEQDYVIKKINEFVEK